MPDQQPQPASPINPPPPDPSNRALRQYFACTALNGILAAGYEINTKNPLATAKLAWAFSDAMIATEGYVPPAATTPTPPPATGSTQ